MRATAAALRDELEIERANGTGPCTTAVAQTKDELAQLKSTVAGLRDSLERTAAAPRRRCRAARALDRAEIGQLQATVRAIARRSSNPPP